MLLFARAEVPTCLPEVRVTQALVSIGCGKDRNQIKRPTQAYDSIQAARSADAVLVRFRRSHVGRTWLKGGEFEEAAV